MARRVLFGSYELIERIGEGGMAEVWRARSRGAAGFQKTVVIKRVLPSLMARADFADLLVREAKIAARLNHPNIVQIFDLGEEQDAYFIAMEYVHGCDLASAIGYRPDPRLCDEDGLSMPLRLWIIGEAARALDYAHRRKSEDGRPLGIVHRDVSPQNILLGYEGQVKVGDFGIAKADEQGLGRDEDPSVLRGKYAYMSPEQARGGQLDNRSDLFSLGIVLWEIVTGQRLFRAKSRTETLKRVRAAQVPYVDVTDYGAPASLGRVIERALANDRDQRYPSVGAFLEDISQVLVEMEAFVDDTTLAQVLPRMFPPDDHRGANKLRVDMMRRVREDATGIQGATALGTTPIASSEHTSALPASRRLRFDDRPVVAVFAHDTIDVATFASAMADFGGFPLPPADGVCEAIFGHRDHPEDAPELATRAALRCLDAIEPQPAILLCNARARVFDGGIAETMGGARQKAAQQLAALSEGGRGGVACEATLEEELSWTFRLQPATEGELTRIYGPRSRSEREAELLRRDAPFVGRRETIRKLTDALVKTAENNEGVGVMLIGAIGVGKSRVLAELRNMTSGSGRAFIDARCAQASRHEAFASLGEIFADLAGLEETDERSVKQEKIERLRVLGLSPRELALVSQLVAGGEPPPERVGRPRGLELATAVRKAVVTIARDEPVVLAIEDVHWMDDATRHVLPVLLAKLKRAPVLTLMTARPSPTLPTFDAVRPMALWPLDPSSGARLFASVIGGRSLERGLARRVIDGTGGHPRWILGLADDARAKRDVVVDDQLVHAVAETELGVPERLATQVAKRVAHLPRLDRSVLHTISAFREPVDLPTLAAIHGTPRDVVERPLRRLLAHRWIVPIMERAPLWPEPGRWGGGGGVLPMPTKMRIAGGTLQRVAVLQTLDDGSRARLHGRVAGALERAGAEDDDARVGQLAYHAVQASDPSHAPPYLVRASEIALRAGRTKEAAQHLSAAARVLRKTAREDQLTELVELSIRGADLALQAGLPDLADETLGHVPPGHDHLTDEVGIDRDLSIGLRLARARVFAHREHWPEVAVALEEVEAAADDLIDVDLELIGEALMRLGHARLESGRVKDACTTLAVAVSQLERDEADQLHALGLCRLAVALARLGRTDEANRRATAALMSAVCLGDPVLRWSSLVAMAEVNEAAGQFKEAAARWTDATWVAREEHLAVEQARSAVRAAAASYEAGLESRAAVAAEEAVRVGRGQKQEAVASLGAAIQGALAVSAHPDPGYVKGMVRGVERLEALGRLGDAALALQMLARVHVALGDIPAAIRTLARARPLADAAGQLPLGQRLFAYAERLAEGKAE